MCLAEEYRDVEVCVEHRLVKSRLRTGHTTCPLNIRPSHDPQRFPKSRIVSFWSQLPSPLFLWGQLHFHVNTQRSKFRVSGCFSWSDTWDEPANARLGKMEMMGKSCQPVAQSSRVGNTDSTAWDAETFHTDGECLYRASSLLSISS